MDEKVIPMRVFQGISGSPAMAIFSARVDPETAQAKVRYEFIEGPTEPSVWIATQKRVAELESDKTVVRIIVSVVISERRREPAKEVFGRIVLPFNRVNGKHP